MSCSGGAQGVSEYGADASPRRLIFEDEDLNQKIRKSGIGKTADVLLIS